MDRNHKWKDFGHIDYWEDMTPKERNTERNRRINADDMCKILVVLTIIYTLLRIISMFY